MSDKKFNLLKYVYGRLYAGTFNKNSIVEKRSKIFGWITSLKWLVKNGYIFSYKVEYVNKECSRITFVFNHSNKIYERYLKAIERNMNINSLSIVPTGEIVEEKNISEFEQERLNLLKPSVEYLSREDRIYKKAMSL